MEDHGTRELIRLAVSGHGEEWARLQKELFSAVDAIAKKIQAWSGKPDGAYTNSPTVLEDVTRLAADWVRAKVERPSLENAHLRAQIVSDYAEAKRRLAEALKAEAETERIRAESIGVLLDNLERLMRFAELLGTVQVARVGSDQHVVLGVHPKKLGAPAGDAVETESPSSHQ